MSDRKWRAVKEIMDTPARRAYFRDFSGMPPELLGSKMEKERYLNALAEKMLHLNEIQPQLG